MASAAPLASFPGWAGPVVRAKRRTGCTDGQFNPPRSLDGASEILEARQRAESLRLIAEAREMGKAHGGVWFQLTMKALEYDLQIGHTPDLADNIPMLLTRFGEACDAFSSNVSAVFGPEGRNAGFAYWTAARGEYAARVVFLIDRLLHEVGKVIGQEAIPADLFEDMDTIVMAFVFPDYGVDPKDDAWRQAVTERFDAVRAHLRAVEATP
ncbi:hypothetical protein [Aureimonas phyllosphaerae]|uniref:Uncharacterized protein n=1 Tax=Aureimonas phyllosphaerae TaxID=1166078 RepID=A0A7W6FSL8_9HYPH|nr:hypothetical protein [Aureimonas phyllosphaerae]MBB3934289.1 hypothetical protein [Aureimonas phyllosphaerae]MBB3958495.1 hypothetical protein [Aureimonas phyllosphaerae]